MIMKPKLYIYLLILIGLIGGLTPTLSSCSDEISQLPSPAPVGDTFTITGSLNLPDMPEIMTRGGFGDTEKANLKLTILEFDLASTAIQSFITNVYHAELKSTTAVANGGTVTFNVTLKAATTPKVLHLMIADNFVSVPADGGSVASLLPALSVGSATSQTEAYWGCVEFEDGYTKTDDNGKPVLRDEVITTLKNVPVIRNFAKITVTESLANFELLGFDVVNCPTTGTIAPWNSEDQEIPELLDGTTMKSYSDITKLPYSGILPSDVNFYNQEATARTWVDGANTNMRSSAARYLYEHPYEKTRRTYLIINGNYTAGDGTITRGFYKIDIGKITTDGNFEYYNIIRNMQYNVVINEVLAPGTATVAEAIDRAPFNNLLASTETSTMLNVSDGKNMLIVNDLNHVIVNENQEVKILYRYITDVTGSKTENNTIPHFIVGEGDVIKKNAAGDYEITKSNSTSASGNWVELTVKTNAPDAYETKEQTITIVDGEGLGRTITLILRRPFDYVKMGENTSTTPATVYTAITYPGAHNYYGSSIPKSPDKVSNATGKNFTVYFNLPDGIPDSVFPLEFTLEAKLQGVENNKIGTMIVTSGASLFDPKVTAIQYIKTVSLEEYKYQYNGEDDSSGFDVGKANTNHTIRCRFTTISAVTSGSTGTIRIYNEYFVNPYVTADENDPYKTKCAEVTFTRDANAAG